VLIRRRRHTGGNHHGSGAQLDGDKRRAVAVSRLAGIVCLRRANCEVTESDNEKRVARAVSGVRQVGKGRCREKINLFLTEIFSKLRFYGSCTRGSDVRAKVGPN
jgi:hypothetical protein